MDAQGIIMNWKFYAGDKVELVPFEALKQGKKVGEVYEVLKTSPCFDKVWLKGEGYSIFDYFDKEKLVLVERAYIKNTGSIPVNSEDFVEVLTLKENATDKQFCGGGLANRFDWRLEPEDKNQLPIAFWKLGSFDFKDNLELRHKFFKDDVVVFFDPNNKLGIPPAKGVAYSVIRCRDSELELKGVDGVFDSSDFVAVSRAFQPEATRKSVPSLTIVEVEFSNTDRVVCLSLHLDWHIDDAKDKDFCSKVVNWRIFNC